MLFVDITYVTSVERRSLLGPVKAIKDCTVMGNFASELSVFIKASVNDLFLASVSDMPTKD